MYIRKKLTLVLCTPEESETECLINQDGSISCNSTVALIPAICLWEKLTIKATPEVSGEYKTSVVLGEKFYDLEETTIDENSSDKIEYSKVKLSDGTIGWVQTRFIATKAAAATIYNEAYIYKRADEVTKTNDKFERFDIVAALEFSEDYVWVKVKGKPSSAKWFKEGWLKNNKISTWNINVSVACLTKVAMKENDLTERKNKLFEIINNASFENSTFIDEVKALAGITDKLKLKWKQVDISQYGNSFYFENEKGEEITFSYIDIPEIDISTNLYYTRYESEESMFGSYEINSNIIGKWYWITTESRQVEQDLSGEIIDTDVIIDIQPAE